MSKENLYFVSKVRSEKKQLTVFHAGNAGRTLRYHEPLLPKWSGQRTSLVAWSGF